MLESKLTTFQLLQMAFLFFVCSLKELYKDRDSCTKKKSFLTSNLDDKKGNILFYLSNVVFF